MAPDRPTTTMRSILTESGDIASTRVSDVLSVVVSLRSAKFPSDCWWMESRSRRPFRPYRTSNSGLHYTSILIAAHQQPKSSQAVSWTNITNTNTHTVNLYKCLSIVWHRSHQMHIWRCNICLHKSPSFHTHGDNCTLLFISLWKKCIFMEMPIHI